MATVNPVKQALEKIGIKQKYHDPVLQKQTRFFLIQIKKLEVFQKFAKTYNPQSLTKEKKSKQQKDKQTKKQAQDKNYQNQAEKKRQWEAKVNFQIGCRQSFTQILLDNQKLFRTEQKLKKKARNMKKKNKDKPDQSKKQIQENNVFDFFANSLVPNKFIEENITSDNKINKANDKPHQKKIQTKESVLVNAAIQQFGNSQDKLFSDMHIFPFQKEEVMTIRLDFIQSVKSNSKEYSKQYGYSLLPLVPLFRMPFTQHSIQVDLVLQNQKKELRPQIVAKLHINVCFLHNFKGRLFVQVIKADLQRNLALIGQMYPIIRMYLRENEFQTQVIEEGGIKPHWKSLKHDEYCYFNIPIQSIFDKLFIYLFYNRDVTIDEIVGRNAVDLQQMAMLKNGQNLKQFMKEAIREIKKIKEDKYEAKKKVKKANELKDQKGDKLELDRRQEIQIELKKLIEKIRQKQIELFRRQLQKLRPSLVRTLMEKSRILSSYNPSPLLTQFVDEIYLIYENQFPATQKGLKNEFLNLIETDSAKKYEWMYGRMIVETLPEKQVKGEIMKVLIEDVNELSEIIDEKMISKEITLEYINPFPKNEAQLQKPVGKLQFNYFFLYEFEHSFCSETEYSDDHYFQ